MKFWPRLASDARVWVRLTPPFCSAVPVQSSRVECSPSDVPQDQSVL